MTLFCDGSFQILNIFNVGYSNQYLISINETILSERILLLFGNQGTVMDKTNQIWDSLNGYGVISRMFHWLMAVLFLWQFISAILRVFVKDSAAYGFFWSAHHTIGFSLLILVLLRGVWGLLNLSKRPRKQGAIGQLAAAGHLVIYILMFAVPALALLRSYGSGRGFSAFGIQVFQQTGVQNAALTAPGNAAHGLLGWVLLAVIVGHVFMALVHHFALRDNTLRHMTGRRAVN